MKTAKILSVCALAILAFTSTLSANGWTSTEVNLARVCVSETNWRTDTEDCAAILQVIDSRRRRFDMSRLAMLRAYSSRATGKLDPLNQRQSWVSGLNARLSKPEGWPDRYPEWRVYRARWRQRLEQARQILEAEPEVCEFVPDQWGGAMDRDSALCNGWTEIDCGHTLNEFWCVPGDDCPRERDPDLEACARVEARRAERERLRREAEADGERIMEGIEVVETHRH